MRRAVRPLMPAALGLLLASLVLGCPTIKIRSLTVESFKKDLAVLAIEVEVDNTADDAGDASTKVAIALPEGWAIQELAYQIPGEPLQRRARPLPSLAIQADWIYDFEGVTWWGFDTAEHAVPAGKHLYPVRLTVKVPKKTKTGRIALVIGDPGPDAESGAFEFELKGKRTVAWIEPPAVNPDSQTSAAGAMDMDMEAMMAGLGEGLAGLGEGLEGIGEAGTMMRQLGTMLGVDTGATGYREEWIGAQMEGDNFRMNGAALVVPEGWSAMGDAPTDRAIKMVLMPPGATTFLGLKLIPGIDAAEATQLFEDEVGQAAAELVAEGTPAAISEVTRTTAGGPALAGRQLRIVTEGSEGLWTMVRLADAPGLAMVVTTGDAATETEVAPLVDQLLDSVSFE